MRKLASIRRVDNLLPIEGADRIELAQIDGWQCIVKKDEFQIGDPCVYFEIDSFLPNKPMFEFLGKPTNHQNRLGFRIKTIKLRGQLSQGLALPVNILPKANSFKLGDDVTDVLSIIKYDPEININNGNIRGGAKGAKTFPSFLRKTDQTRIQNVTSYFKTHKNLEFEETLKLDGSSMTVYKRFKKLNPFKQFINTYIYPFFDVVDEGVCSRNINLPNSNTNQFWAMQNKLNILDKLPAGYAVQGELVSPSIQGNHEKVKEDNFYVFDIYDIENQKYLSPKERHMFMQEYLKGVDHVPIINHSIDIFKECETLDDLLVRVEGQSINPGTVSEGRVFKCTSNPELTFKCISNQYLLKKK